MVALREGSKAAFRDRALLLLGFAGAFRRSELVAWIWPTSRKRQKGLQITIRQSKTEPGRRGAVVAVVRGSVACPVEAVKAWISAAGITEGRYSGRSINPIGYCPTASRRNRWR